MMLKQGIINTEVAATFPFEDLKKAHLQVNEFKDFIRMFYTSQLELSNGIFNINVFNPNRHVITFIYPIFMLANIKSCFLCK